MSKLAEEQENGSTIQKAPSLDSFGEPVLLNNDYKRQDFSKYDPIKLYYSFLIDLDSYLDPTRSRCGHIFSPEKLLSKNKINFLKPWKDPYED